MIVLNGLLINKFRNLKHVNLNKFKDLNIFIGPPNCGKTNILRVINILSNIGEDNGFQCEKCKRITSFKNIKAFIPLQESYLGEGSIEIKYSFNKKGIENLSEIPVDDWSKKLGIPEHDDNILGSTLVQRDEKGNLTGEHISILSHPEIFSKIKDNILFVDEGRVNKDVHSYLHGKALQAKQLIALQDMSSRLVERNILNIHTRNSTIRKKYPEKEVYRNLNEEGSGLRYLSCFMIDIIIKEPKIILIDEPEIGLNPFSKQRMLKELLNMATDNTQIFISTHDPTFVNPLLWEKERVAVFMYSLVDGTFKKVNLRESETVYESFCGYLPHTTSLKKSHIYVEGKLDVLTFQVFLRKYLQDKIGGRWLEEFNKIGIFHLGGDNWGYLIYTIPEEPYKCLVILDGNKREDAERICGNDNSLVNAAQFKFCDKITEIRDNYERTDAHPVYCLEKDDIKGYVTPDVPKEECFVAAEKMEKVPEEIEKLFEQIIKTD